MILEFLYSLFVAPTTFPKLSEKFYKFGEPSRIIWRKREDDFFILAKKKKKKQPAKKPNTPRENLICPKISVHDRNDTV